MHAKIDKKNVENIFELTELQKSIFYDCMRFENPSMYVIQNVFEVNGPFDKTCFLNAIYNIITRHTVLRSVIRWEHMENPVSVITKPDVEKYINWTESDCVEQELILQKNKWCSDLMQKGIKLDADHLIQFDVIHTKNKSILIIQYHHIILDGWSFGILMKELIAHYSRNDTRTDEINYYNIYKQLPVRDDKAIFYWKRKSRANKFILPIGEDKAFESLNRKIIRKTIDADATKKIKQFCVLKNLSLPTYVYAAWSVFLSRYSGQDEISFGVVLSGRDSTVSKVLDTVGLFSNTVTWSDELTDLTIEEVLKQAVEQYNNIQKYQYTPVHVVNALGSNKTGMEAPETLLVFENYPLPEAEGLDIKYVETKENNSFPIIINFFDEDEIRLEFDYIADKYANEDLDRISRYYCALLTTMTEKLSCSINSLDILTDEDMEHQLTSFNPGRRSYPRNTSVAGLIINNAEESPTAKALFHVETEKSMTYEELNVESNDIANALIEKGVNKGDIVCIVMDNCIEFVPSMLGVMRCGAAFLPVNNQLPAERIAQILEDVSPRTVIKKSHEQCGEEKICTDITYVDQVKHSDRVVKNFSKENDTAYLITTSGTTGKSKHVEISNRSFIDFVTWTVEEYQYKKHTRSLLSLSFAFDSAILQVFPTLISTSELFLIDPNRRREPDYYLQILSKYEIEIIDEIPTVLNLMFQKIQRDDLYHGKSLLPALRCISLGSEYVPVDVARGCRKYLNEKAHIINAYGPAETTVVVSTYEFDGRSEEEKSLIGKPRKNTQFFICNEEGRLCPVGVPGEICISGECVAKGYYNNPAETEKKFLKNPYSSGEEYERIYRTGDKGRWLDSGDIEYLGRMDNQVKYHGYRLEVEGLETQIQRVLGGMNVAVALIKQGENEYLTAFIETTKQIQVNDLRNELKKCLPAYAIPSRFICIESLPYNSNGKVDRKRLDQFVGLEKIKSDRNKIVDRQALEIRKLWWAVLGHDDFSDDDNFFEVGGNSITIVKLHMELNEKFPQFQITMGDMFTYSTVNQLNDYIYSLKSDISVKNEQIRTSDEPESDSDDIAVIGIAGYLPMASNIDEFWENLLEGKDCVQEISEERKKLDLCSFEGKQYLKWGYIENVDQFDPLFFKISPRISSYMDPNHRLMLKTAYLALEDAGYYKAANTDYVTGVYLGAVLPNYLKYVKDISVDEMLASNLPANLAGRVSYHLGLNGPSMCIDTACSSSLVALHHAMNAIKNKDCDMALVGGAYIEIEPIDKTVAHTSGIVSKNEKCCSFSDNATGTIGGEGCIALVVKHKSKAINDNDNIYAVIKGSAVNNNGSKPNGLTAPNAEVQANCIMNAWENAKIDPNTVSYIETHGSATKLGDPIEIRGLQLAYQDKWDKLKKIPIGSVKSNIGHLDTVAGLAGLLKVILCLNHKMLVPSIHYQNNNSFIDFKNCPVFVQSKSMTWDGQRPLRAGISSMGISGTNCHVIVEEAPNEREYRGEVKPYYIFKFQGRSHDVLRKQVRLISDFLKKNPDTDVEDLSYTLATRRRQNYSKSFVARDVQSLVENLDKWLNHAVDKLEENESYTEKLSNVSVFYGKINGEGSGLTYYDYSQEKIDFSNSQFTEFHAEQYYALTKFLLAIGFQKENFEKDSFANLFYNIAQEPAKANVYLAGCDRNSAESYMEQSESFDILFGEHEQKHCNIVIEEIGGKEFWSQIANLCDRFSEIHIEPLMQGKTIHLPNDPYEEQSYWLTKEESEDVPVHSIDYEKEKEELIDRKIMHEVVWKEVDTSLFREKKDFYTVIVFRNKVNSCLSFIAKLRASAEKVIVVDCGECYEEMSESEIMVNYEDVDDFIHLYSHSLKTSGENNCTFVCFSDDIVFENKTIDQIEKEMKKTVALITHLCNGMTQVQEQQKWNLCFVTSNAYLVRENDNMLDPLLSIPVSMNRAINSEIKNVSSKVIDMDEKALEQENVIESIGKILVSDLLEVAMRGVKLYQPAMRLQKLKMTKYDCCNFTDHGVYLVTGGLGGLALKMVHRLSQNIKADFILIGRKATEDSEKLDYIQKIRNNGCNVDLQYADISDETQWNQLVDHISDKYGMVSGIIHTAGIVGSRKALLKTEWEDYCKMYQTKVFGTIIMDRMLRRFNPRFTILFSSIDAYLSMLNNTPYSSANYFQQMFAEYYQHLGRNMISISWGGWRLEGMVDNNAEKDVYESVRNYGVVTALKTGFDRETGMKAFDIITKLNIPNSFVSYIDSVDVEYLSKKGIFAENDQIEVVKKDIDCSLESITQNMLQIWESSLKYSPIGLDEHYFECGGDSIIAVEIMFRIQEMYQLSLPVELIFEYGTVSMLSEYVWKQLCDKEEN